MNIFGTFRRRFEFANFVTIHRRSLKAIRAWQGRRLRDIVRHAHRNVPLWPDLFESGGIDPESIRSVDDIARLPITGKDTYRGKTFGEYADGSRTLTEIWSVTSGTTGEPMRSLFAEQYATPLFADFATLRFLIGRGRSLDAISRTRFAHIRKKTFRTAYRFGIIDKDFIERPQEYFQELIDFDPEVLFAALTILFDLAKMNETAETRLTPRFILSSGEDMTPSTREFLQNAFNAEVYDSYGMGEMGTIASECREHDGVHVHAESYIVEVLTPDGTPASEGSWGRVVITSLINYAMPFLRYTTGDIGRLSTAPCPCGLATPRLWLEERRAVTLSRGARVIRKADFRMLTSQVTDVVRFQAAKKAEDALLIRLVPGPTWGSTTEADILRQTTASFGPAIQISLEKVGDIPRDASGKVPLIVDES